MKSSVVVSGTNRSEKPIIKSINQRVYEAFDKFGEIVQGDLLNGFNYSDEDSYLEEFNLDSQKIKKTHLNKDGSISGSYTYKYLENRLIEECFNNINRKYRGDSYILTNTYDDKGKLIKSKRESEPKRWDYTKIFKYNEENQLVEVNEYNHKGLLSKRCKHQYNPEGQLILKEEYGFDGHLSSEENISYEDNFMRGNVRTVYGSSGHKSYVRINSFNQDGNLTFTMSEGKTENLSYTKTGFLVKHIRENEILSYLYETDDKGNWIKKTHFRNDIPFAITIREIEYH